MEEFSEKCHRIDAMFSRFIVHLSTPNPDRNILKPFIDCHNIILTKFQHLDRIYRHFSSTCILTWWLLWNKMAAADCTFAYYTIYTLWVGEWFCLRCFLSKTQDLIRFQINVNRFIYEAICYHFTKNSSNWSSNLNLSAKILTFLASVLVCWALLRLMRKQVQQPAYITYTKKHAFSQLQTHLAKLTYNENHFGNFLQFLSWLREIA